MRIPLSATLRSFALGALLFAATNCGEHHASGVVSPSSPALLQCPSTQTSTTSAVVTALGGLVNLGGTSVKIPAAALTAATTITLTLPASPYMEIEVNANNLTSFVFQQPISITIDYSRCPAAEASKTPLTVWHIDPQTKQLLDNMGGVDDKTTHSITFTTGHLSGYAVAF